MSARVAACLSEEFAQQALEERSLGLPVSVMVATTAPAKAAMEKSFICAGGTNLCVARLCYTFAARFSRPAFRSLPPLLPAFVVRPLYKLLVEISPPLAVTLTRIDANLAAWDIVARQ